MSFENHSGRTEGLIQNIAARLTTTRAGPQKGRDMNATEGQKEQRAGGGFQGPFLGPGFHLDVPMADYVADALCEVPTLSASTAQILWDKSPLHAWLAHPRLGGAANPSGRAAETGTAAHEILLEGGESRIAICDATYLSGPRKGEPVTDWTAAGAKTFAAEARAAGKIPMLAHERDAVLAMVNAARSFIAETELAGILDRGVAESTLVWNEGGALCRCRPDWLPEARKRILHYKTTGRSVRPEEAQRHFFNEGWDLTAWHYALGAKAVFGSACEQVFLIQEQAPPFACCLMEPGAMSNDIARRKHAFISRRWSDCLASGEWPGYPSRIILAEPDAFAVVREEEMLSKLTKAASSAKIERENR